MLQIYHDRLDKLVKYQDILEHSHPGGMQEFNFSKGFDMSLTRIRGINYIGWFLLRPSHIIGLYIYEHNNRSLKLKD